MRFAPQMATRSPAATPSEMSPRATLRVPFAYSAQLSDFHFPAARNRTAGRSICTNSST